MDTILPAVDISAKKSDIGPPFLKKIINSDNKLNTAPSGQLFIGYCI